jgi:hypothetical protein
MEPLAGVALQLEDIEFTRDSIGKEYLHKLSESQLIYQPGTLQLSPVMSCMKVLKIIKEQKNGARGEARTLIFHPITRCRLEGGGDTRAIIIYNLLRRVFTAG